MWQVTPKKYFKKRRLGQDFGYGEPWWGIHLANSTNPREHIV